jgi:hypothetical protein
VEVRQDTGQPTRLRETVVVTPPALPPLANANVRQPPPLAPPEPMTAPAATLAPPRPALAPPAFAPPPVGGFPQAVPVAAFAPPLPAVAPGTAQAPPSAAPPANVPAAANAQPSGPLRVAIVSSVLLNVQVVRGQAPGQPGLAPLANARPAGPTDDGGFGERVRALGGAATVVAAGSLATLYAAVSGLDAVSGTLTGSFTMLRNEVGIAIIPVVVELAGYLQSAARWVRTVNEATGGWAGQLAGWTLVAGAGVAVLGRLVTGAVSTWGALTGLATGNQALAGTMGQTALAANVAAASMGRLNVALAANAVAGGAAAAAGASGGTGEPCRRWRRGRGRRSDRGACRKPGDGDRANRHRAGRHCRGNGNGELSSPDGPAGAWLAGHLREPLPASPLECAGRSRFRAGGRTLLRPVPDRPVGNRGLCVAAG